MWIDDFVYIYQATNCKRSANCNLGGERSTSVGTLSGSEEHSHTLQ